MVFPHLLVCLNCGFTEFSVSEAELQLLAERAAESVVRCTGRITSDTAESLKSEVKSLLASRKAVVLDLTNVDYLDSTGLGTIVGLYVSAKTAKSQLKLINPNKRLKELFSLTQLGEVIAEGRDPKDFGIA